jgi:hypothetical protein
LRLTHTQGVLQYYRLQMSKEPTCYVERFGILLITVLLIAGMAGCGSSSQNLEIRTWYDLDAVRNNLLGHHILMNNLDSTTAGYEEVAGPTANQRQGWKPIGTEDDLFVGTFDGQGYEIHDLFSNHTDEMYAGLFGVVGEEGVVQNVGVVGSNVTGDNSVGGLAGKNSGTVSNSYSTGNVTGTRWVGGLVGVNLGTVSNSYSGGGVTGNECVGGLVGNNSGTASNSYSTSSVIGDANIGGLLGDNEGTVGDSYSRGSVTGNTYVGGLVGRNSGTVSISFWDTQTSGQGSSAGGTAKTTTQMKDIATFSGGGWDIVAVAGSNARNLAYVWNIVDDVTYPFLSWQPV